METITESINSGFYVVDARYNANEWNDQKWNIKFSIFFYRTSNIKDGTIKMNGRDRNISQFRKLSAYIMQDNQLHGNLTVEEAMTVAANLKLSSKVIKHEKNVVVR